MLCDRIPCIREATWLVRNTMGMRQRCNRHLNDGYSLVRMYWPWTEPPPGVPEGQWADAIVRGLTERYRPIPEERLVGLTHEKAMKDLYG